MTFDPTATPPIWPLQSECVQAYGDPRGDGWLEANTVHVPCPWPLTIGNTPVSAIVIHRFCAPSLERVLNNIWDGVNKDLATIKSLRYDRYSGSYNLRNIRGSVSALSMHAFAAAIDFDAEDNQQHSQQHLFTDDSLLVKCFKAEGWIWGGDWSPGSIDAMHVQAARVHP